MLKANSEKTYLKIIMGHFNSKVGKNGTTNEKVERLPNYIAKKYILYEYSLQKNR